METQADRQTGRRRGMVVALEDPCPTEEVDGNQTRCLDDLDQAVVVLQRRRYTRERGLEELRFLGVVLWRVGEVAAHEAHRGEKRWVRPLLGRGRQRRSELPNVQVKSTLMTMLEEYVEPVRKEERKSAGRL